MTNGKINYVCSGCGATGIKLWRQYMTFLDKVKLLCVDCGLEDQGKSYIVRTDGSHQNEHGRCTSYQLDNLVPAVLTAEQDTFWGYCGGPQEDWDAWHKMPLRASRLVTWTCRFCGETLTFENDADGFTAFDNVEWWDAHDMYGVRRCGEPTPDHLKRPCPKCHGTGNDPGIPPVPGGLKFCSCCDGTGKVNLP